MRITLFALSSLVLLPACNGLQLNSSVLDGGTVPASASAPAEDVPPQDGVAEDAAGTPAAPAFTGTSATVASLGDPSVPGLWMETPLVSSEQTARVRTSAGVEAVLTLKPVPGEPGAGSRLSIEAMRALGAPLTELVELQVLPAG